MAMTRTAYSVLALSLLAGCSESGTVKVDGRVAETTAVLAHGTSLELADGLLVVESARISVSEIELEGGDEDDELEATVGGAVIDLTLDGSPTNVEAGTVEAGRYHTVGLELESAGSVVVRGTYDGRPFTFTSDLRAEIEFPIEPAVQVPADGEATVGIAFDVAAWFAGTDGAVVDPTDPASRERIEANLLAAMAAAGEVETEDDD